jgi:excisionase family DNA binding protein
MAEVLTAKEVSARYKLPMGTVSYLVATGGIPFTRLSKRIVRFDSDRLDRWFKEGQDKPYTRTEKESVRLQ